MTPIAHAVRFAMRCGITDVADLASELECTQSAIYRAMKQLSVADRTVTDSELITDRTVKSDATVTVQHAVSDRTVSKSDATVTNQQPDEPRAYKESSSKIVIISPPSGGVGGWAAGPDEEELANGVIVNCRSIRHPNFTISLDAIAMQTIGRATMAEIKPFATGKALEWADQIAAGKPPERVVPSNTASLIRAGLLAIKNNDVVTEVRATKAAKSYTPQQPDATRGKLVRFGA